MSEIITELANCVESKGLSNEPETTSSSEVTQSQESVDNELKENTNADKSKEIETETNTEEKQVKQLDTKCIDEHNIEHFKEYAEHVTYEADGSAVYTDPETKFQYKWCTAANSWLAKDTSNNPYENEHYRWCSDTQKWLPKQLEQEVITETEHYKWDAEKQEWLPKQNLNTKNNNNNNEIKYSIDEQGQRIYTDQDGTVYSWDAAKNAWFPKIDDDFMAIYQMNYGFNNDTTDSKESEKNEENEKARAEALKKEQELKRLSEEATEREQADKQQGAKRKLQEPPKWFDIDPAHNTKVYVSNLPLDITLEEFTELMSKCGLIMRDPQTQKYKIKLYTEPDGQIKGDGLCDYIKVESVDLALNILDEYNLRGHKIRVQRAKFQMRGEYNPALKPKRKKKDKEKLAKIKEKLFDWRPEKMRGERSKHEKIVIIKNLFQPDIFEKEVQLILEYQNDLREECSKCGQVRKVIIYDRHTEGVAQINMSTAEEADLVIQMMQGRFFGKRQLTAEHWDGKTKYKIEESETEAQKRLNKWDEFLETEESKDSSKTEENPTEMEESAVDAKIEEGRKEEKDITPAAESVQTSVEN